MMMMMTAPSCCEAIASVLVARKSETKHSVDSIVTPSTLNFYVDALARALGSIVATIESELVQRPAFQVERRRTLCLTPLVALEDTFRLLTHPFLLRTSVWLVARRKARRTTPNCFFVVRLAKWHTFVHENAKQWLGKENQEEKSTS